MIYVGIDPGISGGIAVIAEDGSAWAFKMPETELDLVDQMFEIALQGKAVAVIEHVTGFINPYHGGKGGRQGEDDNSSISSAVSAFKFGRNYGACLAAVAAAGIDLLEQCPAQRWQKHWQVKRAKSEKRTVWKQRLRQLAAEQHPTLKVTLAIGDALLIAGYCRHIAQYASTVELSAGRKK